MDMDVHRDPTHDVTGWPLLLTREEVAAVLQVPADTVDNLHRVRHLRGCRVGKHLRWRPDDVRSFVAKLGDETDGEGCRV